MKALNKSGYVLLGAAIVLVAGSAATAGALTGQFSGAAESTPAISVIYVSDAPSNLVDPIVSSAPQKEVSKIVSSELTAQITSTGTELKKPPAPKYDIMDPKTGELISPNDPRYEALKSQLGGDAGTVPYDKSTANQAALEKEKGNVLSAPPVPAAPKQPTPGN